MIGLINGHAVHIPLKDESVHMVVTSPPYWGLRDYNLPPLVWGHERCWHGGEHVWNNQIITDTRGTQIGKAVIVDARESTRGQFCQHCDAWRGSLGLEPTPELYVEHMVEIFREVRRVLRADGTVFLNLGDSYYSTTRQTGRNDGGRPQKGRGWAEYDIKRTKVSREDARRAAPCGTYDKEPGDYQDRGCLCGSFCDVCRVAYRSRKSHNDGLLVAMLTASLSVPSLGHTESEYAHLPTSDFLSQGSHNSLARQDQGQIPDLAGGQFHALLVSMLGESSPQLLDVCLQRDRLSSCLLCGHSLTAYAQGFAHKLGGSLEQSSHSQDNALRADQQVHRNQYRDRACEYCAEILSSEPSYIQPRCTTDRPISQTLKPKDLVGIPWRVAFALQADGWWLRSDIIWKKLNPMPESVTDRPTKAHEYLFLLSKSARYFYDADAIREPVKLSSIERMKYTFNPNRGDGAAQVGKRAGSWKPEQFNHPAGRNRRTVWTIATKPYTGAHFATYPPALVEPCIKAGTSERGVCPTCGGPWERVCKKEFVPQQDVSRERGIRGAEGQKLQPNDGWDGYPRGTLNTETTGWRPTCDCDAGDPVPATVFDPFVGSGTTLLVARKLGRHGIGLDYSFPYLRDQARPRLSLDALDEWEEGRTVEEEAWRDTLLFQTIS